MPIKVGTWRRDFAGLEQRRLEAARMFAHGASQAEVARTFGVSPQAASVWYRRWRQGGEAALHGAGRAGRRPRLQAAELAAVDQALRKGPAAFGFDTDLWTLGRIAQVIEQLTGSGSIPGTCGGCCAGWAGACSGPPAAPVSATRPPSPAGGPRSGPGSRGGAEPRRLDLLPG
jgi:transposase